MTSPARETADLIVHSGAIHTVDPADSVVECLVVRDGRIVAAGSNALRGEYSAAESVDLRGRAVIPGFVDSHIHIHGDAPWHIDLTKMRSIAEICDGVRAKAAGLPEGHWVTGFGWAEDQLAENRLPHRKDLDEAAPGNPVVLTRAGAHSAVANSRAFAAAGLDSSSPDPDGGVLERDPDGELSGVIRERQDLVLERAPVAKPEETRADFVRRLRDLLRLGITSIVQAADTPDNFPEWEHVYNEHRGELPRASVQQLWQGARPMAAFGKKTGDGDEWLRVGAVKVFVDGGFTGPAAYTSEPYKGQGDYRGKLNLSLEALQQQIYEAHDAGWQLGIHAIGDAAIALTVDSLAKALTRAPRDDHRHYLNHFTLMPPPETMETMARHSIGITTQANFLYTLEQRYVDNLDGERLERNNPLRTPMNHGIHLALSSDILPIGPFVGLYAATTRKGRSGRVFAEDERLSIHEAIRAYTQKGAFLTFEEGEKGSLEPGKAADFVVLDHDPYAVDPGALLDAEVVQTYLAGRLVYER